MKTVLHKIIAYGSTCFYLYSMYVLSHRGLGDGVTSLPEPSEGPEGEVLRMSSALPTMWLGAQNGW